MTKNINTADLFNSAEWYDVSINWQARMKREIPVMRDVFGTPGKHGLLDAACSTGRHIVAMTEAGYRVTGIDLSDNMLSLGRKLLSSQGIEENLIQAAFEDLPEDAGPFDGVYCLGNSFAAVGEPGAIERSIARLAAAIVPGGSLFLQILNFEKLRLENPSVRGPRVVRRDGTEFLSNRLFSFDGKLVRVTSVTMWNDGQAWRQFAGSGSLYGISKDELVQWCESNGLAIRALYGNYNRDPFDPASSNDLIVVATKTP